MVEPISEYKYAGNFVKVFQNRIEFGTFIKKEMIVFRNISSIEANPLIAGLTIKTNDGKKYTIPVSLTEKSKLKGEIEERL